MRSPGDQLPLWAWAVSYTHLDVYKRQELGLPVLDYRNTLDSIRKLLAREVQLDHEQVHLARAAAFHADSPGVITVSYTHLSPRRWVPRCGGGVIRSTVSGRCGSTKAPSWAVSIWVRR